MARPSVFVSSTFYDLQHIRNDLEVFIQEMGYQPVLFERGQVAWSQDQLLEDRCYAEIRRCDIVVSVIGNRYGSDSRTDIGSIAQNELKHALDQGKQVYVFVLSDVENTQRIYAMNKEREVEYGVDIRILQFFEEVRALPTTGVYSFRSAGDITGYLREQWAGLFQDLLASRQQVRQQAAINKVAEVISIVQRDYVEMSTRVGVKIDSSAEQLKTVAEAMQKSLEGLLRDRWAAMAINFPGILQVRKLLELKHRAYILTADEFVDWMRSIGFSDHGEDDDGWRHFHGDSKRLKIRSASFFTAKGALLAPPPVWDEQNVELEFLQRTTGGFDEADYGANDDDIPF